MGSSLDELLERIKGLDPDERVQLEQDAIALEAGQEYRWVPSPGPQTDAYFCEADILLYGGEAGGGKSDLGLGLAFNEHRRSLIMRREGVQLGGLTARAIEINGTKLGYNGSSPPKLTTRDQRLLEFGSALNSGDEASWKGRPHDLLVFDEAVEFLETQVRFLLTWVRSIVDGQRCRVVLATNPPISEDGQWLVEMFAPWLDPQHPNPAKPGELRWFIVDGDGRDQEVDGPDPVDVNGTLVRPLSRTFIPSSVRDNPFLACREDYLAKLDSLPEPYRSAFRDGNFMVARQDDLRQAIPSAWIRDAMRRWKPEPPIGVPMCAMGVDVARGGRDETTICPRFDWWFSKIIAVPGAQTPLGTDVAGLVIKYRYDNATVIIDLGGGFGGEPYGHLIKNGVDCEGWLGMDPTNERTADRKLGFTNKRSCAIWRFREALDPGQPGGSPIALPPDPRLAGDLAAPRFEITARGIKVEPKEDVCERLGRSTDRGDGVVMAWTGGAKQFMQQGGWAEHGRSRTPRVVMKAPRRASA